jgi:hypothetical protein
MLDARDFNPAPLRRTVNEALFMNEARRSKNIIKKKTADDFRANGVLTNRREVSRRSQAPANDCDHAVNRETSVEDSLEKSSRSSRPPRRYLKVNSSFPVWIIDVMASTGTQKST